MNGTMLGGQVFVFGSAFARLRIEWQLAGQNIAGNFSTINVQAYVDFFGCDAQLDAGYVNWNGGALYSNPGRVYNYAANFSNHTVTLGGYTVNVAHNVDGTATLLLNGSIQVYQAGNSNGSGSWGLPQIPRYANITTFYADLVNDQGFRFNWAADNNCDYVSWWSSQINGGAHNDIPVSGSGLFSISQNNLPSEKTYDLTVAVRRADSGLWTTSNTIYTTTLKQNNMFPVRVP